MAIRKQQRKRLAQAARETRTGHNSNDEKTRSLRARRRDETDALLTTISEFMNLAAMSVAARFFYFLPSDNHPKGTDKKTSIR
jgi:hypothetical protein